MKRRNFIQQELRYRRQITEMVPVIYAAFAVALHRHYGFGAVRTGRILAETQEIWRSNSPLEILAMCRNETGIDMVSETTAKEKGIEGRKI